MAAPAEFSERPPHDAAQPVDAETPAVATSTPLEESAKVTDEGRMPSWSFASSQTFCAVTETVAGTCLLVMVQEEPVCVMEAA